MSEILINEPLYINMTDTRMRLFVYLCLFRMLLNGLYAYIYIEYNMYYAAKRPRPFRKEYGSQSGATDLE